MRARRLSSLTSTVLAGLLLLGACSPAQDQVAGAGRPTVDAGATADPAPTIDAEPSTPAPSPSDTTPSVTPGSPPASESPAPDTSATPEPGATPRPGPSSEPGPDLVPVGEEDSGEDVRALQQRLEELGYEPGPVDGVYGERTAGSVTAYQHAAGLEITGRTDAPTVRALEEGAHAVTVLGPGDRGAAVRQLQEMLADAPVDPGPVDGIYGGYTVQAVYALEKLAGVTVDGRWDGLDRYALARLREGVVGGAGHDHDRRWVEVDLTRQLMSVYDPEDPGTPVLVSHVSTGNRERWCNDTAGCRVAATPTGSFTISRRIDGWRESSLDIGRLYNPLYFRGGIALHGALSVPLYPASHGCVRVPMHIAEYLPDMLPNGTPVEVSW